MKQKLTILAAIGLLLVTGLIINKANNAQALYPGLVAVLSIRDGQTCTGVVISDDRAITAAHCVGGYDLPPQFGGQFRVIEPVIGLVERPGAGTVAQVLWANGHRDIAMVTGDFKKFKKAYGGTDLDIHPIEMTKRYKYCGFQGGAKKPACVSLGNPTQNFGFQALFSAVLIPGASGGPVFEEDTGYLVGILYGAITTETFSGVIVTPLIGVRLD